MTNTTTDAQVQSFLRDFVHGVNDAAAVTRTVAIMTDGYVAGRAAYEKAATDERARLGRSERIDGAEPLNFEETEMVMRGNRIDAARAYHERTGLSKGDSLRIVAAWDRRRKVQP